MNEAQQAVQTLIEQVNHSVVGQHHVTQALVIGLLTGGHVLLEGLPGTAKTRSVKALASALNTSFGRIQFTPDLLPSDVTGTEVYQELDGKPRLSFQAGPIFNAIVLADEINRAPAKVQAALLEAMAEKTLTVADTTHTLPDLFMVLATQNPIEQEGTYPLPEAQMDRFILKVEVNHPDEEAELAIIRLVRNEEALVTAAATNVEINAIDPAYILQGRQQLRDVHIAPSIEKYIVQLVMATRCPEQYPDSSLQQWLQMGMSPRATISLDKCCRAHAWLDGRQYVEPDDVRAIAHGVMAHRLYLSYDAIAEGITSKDVVDALLTLVPFG